MEEKPSHDELELWIDTGVHYKGRMILVNYIDGSMAQKRHDGKMDKVSDEIEDLVTNILLIKDVISSTPKDVLDKAMANNRKKFN